MNLSLFATACSGLRIEFYQVVLLASELGGVTAVVHDLAANNYLVTYLLPLHPIIEIVPFS